MKMCGYGQELQLTPCKYPAKWWSKSISCSNQAICGYCLRREINWYVWRRNEFAWEDRSNSHHALTKEEYDQHKPNPNLMHIYIEMTKEERQ